MKHKATIFFFLSLVTFYKNPTPGKFPTFDTINGRFKVYREPGGGYSHTLPIWVCAAQRGRDFEAPDLERGIKNCGSGLYLLPKIVADNEEAFI